MGGSDDIKARRIGFVGGGNMASAMVRGLLDAGLPPARVRIAEPLGEKRSALEACYDVEVVERAGDLDGADLFVIAVKPDRVGAALAEMSRAWSDDALLVSVAAGVPTAVLEAGLPEGAAVVRAMPNTPAMALAGASAIAPGRHAEPADMRVARALFEAVGEVVEVQEKALDAVTGLSGSGPAYVLLVIEALAEGGVRAGLSRDVAQLLATQTVRGTAALLADAPVHPAVLRERVTSPGGTTAAGLAVLERAAARAAFADAVAAASARSAELGAKAAADGAGSRD